MVQPYLAREGGKISNNGEGGRLLDVGGWGLYYHITPYYRVLMIPGCMDSLAIDSVCKTGERDRYQF